MREIRRIGLHIALASLASVGSPAPASAQHEASPDPHTLSGYIEDAASGERLVGATLRHSGRGTGTTTNAYGFFSLELSEDTARVHVSYVGYRDTTLVVALRRDSFMVVSLRTRTVGLGEVEIVAQQVPAAGTRALELSPQQIRDLPALLGETDVLKAVQLMPGVQGGVDGSAGIYVRGGGPDQNLILLDGAPIYNAGHLFGFMSVFNNDAVQRVRLVKGGFPARYGGRLSSVLDISLKEGNLQRFAGTVGVGLLSSRVTIEGPLRKKKSSFMVSVRRANTEVIQLLTDPGGLLRNGYYFYDVNAKANYIFSPQSRIYVSLYRGRDRLHSRMGETIREQDRVSRERRRSSLAWGNQSATVRWTRVLGPKVFASAMLRYTRYQFETADEDFVRSETPDGVRYDSVGLGYGSGVRDGSVSLDLDYLAGARHSITAGIGATHHRFNPGAIHYSSRTVHSGPVEVDYGRSNIVRALETTAYVEDHMQITPWIWTNIGLHASAFTVQKDVYRSIEPRLLVRITPHRNVSVEATLTQMRQYLHLLTNSGIGLPTDLWLPATARIGPQRARQASIGATQRLPGGWLDVSVEGFYKEMRGLIEYKEGASYLRADRDWQDKVERGEGLSYGVELMLRKRKGRITGWIGYTLSKASRRFAELNGGRWFPYRYDRRHDVSIVSTVQLSDDKKLSLTWVYATGSAVTLPTSRYSGQYVERQHFDSRNGFRMPSYHRLDVAYQVRRELNRGERVITIGLYNAYNHLNPFYLDFDEKEIVDPGTGRVTDRVPVLKQVSLLPILPVFSYRYSF